MNLKGTKGISKAGGGIGTRARAEGLAAIRPRCEGSMSEGRGVRHVRHVKRVGEGVREKPKRS